MTASTYGTRGRHRRPARTLGERAAVPAQTGVKFAAAGLIGTALAVAAAAASAGPALAGPNSTPGVGADAGASSGPATLTAAIAPIQGVPSPAPFSFPELTPGPPYPPVPIYPGTNLGPITIFDGPRTITFSGNPQDAVHVSDLSQPQGQQDTDVVLSNIFLSENHCVFVDNGCTSQLQTGTYYAGTVKISYLPMIPVSDDPSTDQSPNQAAVLKINDSNSQPMTAPGDIAPPDATLPDTSEDAFRNMLDKQRNQQDFNNAIQNGLTQAQQANMTVDNSANDTWGNLIRLAAEDPSAASAYTGGSASLQLAMDSVSPTAPVTSTDGPPAPVVADDTATPPVDDATPPVAVTDNAPSFSNSDDPTDV